jgi:hypothetical protein
MVIDANILHRMLGCDFTEGVTIKRHEALIIRTSKFPAHGPRFIPCLVFSRKIYKFTKSLTEKFHHPAFV